MSEMISRQDAIDAVHYYIESGYKCDIFQELKDLSSAEPERKHGEWLPHPHEREWDVCSVCGTGCKRREYEMQFGQEKFSEYSYQYCPNCGARLEWKHENL